MAIELVAVSGGMRSSGETWRRLVKAVSMADIAISADADEVEVGEAEAEVFIVAVVMATIRLLTDQQRRTNLALHNDDLATGRIYAFEDGA